MMEQITSQAVMWRAVAGVLGVLLLIVVLLIWKRKKVSLKPAIVGAITFVVFAQVLAVSYTHLDVYKRQVLQPVM